MRMIDQRKDINAWVEYLTILYENGVDTLHSSVEYESFQLLTEVLRLISKKSDRIKFKHVVKLADPTFNEEYQSYNRIRKRIEEYTNALNCSQIEMVQWMWRNDLNNDEVRVSKFTESLQELDTEISKIKNDGLVNRFLCFPYTLNFGIASLESSVIDGFMVYRNPCEMEFQHLLDEAYKKSKDVYSIRPLAAGSLIQNPDWDVNSLIKFSYNHPGVKGIIVSISQEKHLLEILNCL
jgi:hypothetical protein